LRLKLTYEPREIREKFKDLFEYSLDLIYVHDLKGKFLDANDIALSTLGFTREEISNISFSKLLENDQLEKAFNILKELKEFGSQKCPSEYKLKDRYGNRIYLETYGIPLKTNGQIFGILGIAKDITAKKKAELQLKQAKQDLEQINLELENKVRKKTQKLEKSAQNLKSSEEKYRDLIETSTMGLLEIDLQKDRVEYINPKFMEISGFNRKELEEGQLFHKIIYPENYKEIIKTHDSEDIEFRTISKDKDIKWLSGTRVFQYNSKGKPINLRLWVQDISRIKESELKLKESEEKYRLITESISDPLHVVDTDLKIIYLNPAFTNWLKALGLNHEVIGKNPTEAFPFIEKNVIKEYQEIFNSKKEFFLEGYSLLNNKRIFTETKKIPVLNDGKVIQIITIVRDVSERKEIDLKLRESEEKYRSILENINEGYFEVDLKGNFTFFNDALCVSTDYSREELLNKSYSILFDDKTAKDVYRMYHELYQRGKGFILFDYQVIRKDGNKFYHESSIYLRYDSNGKIIGFKGFIRDISEKKKIETLRERFSQELEKEVELKTKELKVAFNQQRLYLDKILKASHFQTEFMARISHELRTPLNAIIGFTALLLEGVYGQLNVVQLEFIKDIEESSKDLLDMISNILDISKIESGQVLLKIEKIQIFDLMQQIISTLNPLYSKKNLKFELKGLKKNQVISVDRIKFKQIIFNLLSNAIKFTEKGTIIFEFVDSKDKWEFIVKDTGIGISKEDFNIIFKEFKRVRSASVDSKPGSGLGLALTKRLVNLHGGDISFKSKLGKGSTFTFFLPKRLEISYNSNKSVTQFLEYL